MNKFFQFLSGDFLRHPGLQKWYPFILLLISLALISIVNEKIINQKSKTLERKRYEYKMALNQLKKNNHYLPYRQQKIIREKASKRGFIENHKGMYKIVVND
jgi:hypothetical protein